MQKPSLTSSLAIFFVVNRHKIRLSILIIAIISQIILLIMGSGVFLSSEQAKLIIESVSSDFSWNNIAVHNMQASIFGFVPILGVGWQCWLSFNTGFVLKALAITHNSTPIWLLWEIANFPHFWLEITAIALAPTTGIMFFLGLLTRRRTIVFHELKCVAGSLLAWALLLITASCLETVWFAPFLWVVLIPIIIGITKLDDENWGYSSRLAFVAIIFLYVSFFVRFSCFNLFPSAFLGFLSLPLFRHFHGLIKITREKIRLKKKEE